MSKSTSTYLNIFVIAIIISCTSCQQASVKATPNLDALRLWSIKNSSVTSTVWDAKTDQEAPSLNIPKSVIESLAWSPDGEMVASGSHGGEVIIWESSSGKKLLSFGDSTESVGGLAWSPDGKQLASGGHKIRIWDTQTGEQLQVLPASTEETFIVAWSPVGNKLASISYDGQGSIWDVSTGEKLLSLKTNRFSRHIAWSPQGNLLGTSYPRDGIGREQATLWNPETGEAVLTQPGVYDLAWSPIGNTVVSVSDSGTLNLGDDTTLVLWDARSGEKIRRIYIDRFLSDIDWSPDGKLLIIAEDAKHSLIVLNAETGEKIHILEGHTSLVTHVAWSPRGDLIASSSWDGTVIIWRVNDQ